MRKFVLTSIICTYLYIWWLSISLFLIPAMKLFFEMYGVWGTFGIWIALFIGGFTCGYIGTKIYLIPTTHQLKD